MQRRFPFLLFTLTLESFPLSPFHFNLGFLSPLTLDSFNLDSPASAMWKGPRLMARACERSEYRTQVEPGT